MKKVLLFASLIAVYFFACANPKEVTDGQENKKTNKKKVETAHFWNQLEYDSMYHFILQERFLNLNITANQPENLRNKSFIVSTHWDDEFDTEEQFNSEGAFSKKMPYSQSRFTIATPAALLTNPGAINEISYDWFHPDQWFKSLDLEFYTEGVHANYQRVENSNLIQMKLTYPAHLQAYEGDGGFGSMLGISFDFTGKYEHEKKRFWIKEASPGKIIAMIDLTAFFQDYYNSYSEPYQVGDTFNVDFSAVLHLAEGMPNHVKSNRKDPKYKKKTYTPRKWGRGNFHGDLPSIEPSYAITIHSSQQVVLVAEDLAID